MEGCQHITSSCVKRLLHTIIPSVACFTLLPEVITHSDPLAEQPDQILLYYSKKPQCTKELQFKMSRLILTKLDLENLILSPGISCRSNLMGI